MGEINHFLSGVKSVYRLKDLNKIFLQTLNRFGYHYYIFSPYSFHSSMNKNHIRSYHCPDKLINFYFKEQILKDDQVVKAFHSINTCFFWEDVLQESRHEQYMVWLNKSGFKSNITIPIRQLNGDLFFIHLSSKNNISKDSATKYNLHLICLYYFFSYEKIVRSKLRSETIKLTGREKEVLYWFSQGKTFSEIALIIGITKKTCEYHMKNLKEKLDVSSGVHLIAKAMDKKIIN